MLKSGSSEMLWGSQSEMDKSHEKPYGLSNVAVSAFIILIQVLFEQLLADAEIEVGQHL